MIDYGGEMVTGIVELAEVEWKYLQQCMESWLECGDFMKFNAKLFADALNPVNAIKGMIDEAKQIYEMFTDGRAAYASGRLAAMILEKVVTKGAGGAAALVIKNALKKGCSFEGDTQVLMADGSAKPIENIEAGDEVLATDPETGEQEARPVEATHVHDDILITLVLVGPGGSELMIRTTEDHPFWSETDQEFQRADSLSSGELVLDADGDTVEVARIDRDVTWAPAWNLTVAGFHTYHVLTDPDRGPPLAHAAVEPGASGILVHNCGTGARSGDGLSDNELLASAQALRDEHVVEVVGASSKRQFPGAVTAGYNIETREFAAGHSTKEGGRAEICVVNQLGGDPTKIRFTAAIRPRKGTLQEICPACEITFRRDQFVDPQTTFRSDRIFRGE